MDRELRARQRSEDWRRVLLQYARQSELIVLPPQYNLNSVKYILILTEDPGLQDSYEDGRVHFKQGRQLEGYKSLEIELQLYSEAYKFFKTLARNHCQQDSARITELRNKYSPRSFWWRS